MIFLIIRLNVVHCKNKFEKDMIPSFKISGIHNTTIEETEYTIGKVKVGIEHF